MGRLRWLSNKGDSEIEFNNCFEILSAKKKFKKLSKQGYLAFAKATESEPMTRAKKFDKNAHEIVMIPRIAGG